MFRLHRQIISWLTLLTALVSLSGCIAPAPPPNSIDETPLEAVATIDAEGVFAVNGQATHLAFASEGLKLRKLSQQDAITLNAQAPKFLAWNTSGEYLAAAYDLTGHQALLTIYTADGEVIREESLPVTPLNLRWSDRGDLLLAGYALKIYSFGSNLSQKLYIITNDDLTEVLLGDTTLKPRTSRMLAEVIPDYLAFTFSGPGDELVYTRLHDPPEFPPYLNLVYRNWQVPTEKPLAQIGLQPVRLDLDMTREEVRGLAGTKTHVVPLLSSETETVTSAELKPGRYSPRRLYRFSAGRLFRGDALIHQWPETARLQFLAAGRFLLADGNTLYLGNGLEPENVQVYDDRAWMLRRWLHQGLITVDEYRETISGGMP